MKFRIITIILTLSSAFSQLFAQKDSLITPASIVKEDKPLRFNLSEDGVRYFQVTFLNQTWVRYNESNEGTTVKGQAATETFDIGLRRTRIQMFGQITERAFLYFQFGQNNFNYLSQISGSRKLAAFFHDAVTEYRVSNKNQLKIGGGLTIVNGLSRFSQPSIGTIASLDVPVFAQATVDQTDLFSRKMSIYARGQIGKFDYRFSLSQPFPISTNGLPTPKISKYATFADSSLHKQVQGYVIYQFFEHEPQVTPGYMTGTYLGAKKIFNIAAGAILQPKATHRLDDNNKVILEDMKLFCIESFLDMPLNKAKQTAINAYLGLFSYNFGKNYLRFNGLMNPADGIKGAGTIAGAQGNAFPMMGTGKVLYTQLAFLLPKNLFGTENTTRASIYGTAMITNYERIGSNAGIYGLGLNWHINKHKAKISIELQNRPTYKQNLTNDFELNNRKSSVILQYQIFI